LSRSSSAGRPAAPRRDAAVTARGAVAAAVIAVVALLSRAAAAPGAADATTGATATPVATARTAVPVVAATATAATGRALIARRLPRVTYRGGPFVRRPELVTVTFAGDDPAVVATVERFGASITRGAWWRAVATGFCAAPDDCVGDGRPGRSVRLDVALPASLHAVDVERLLTRALADGRLGAVESDTVVLVYLPAHVALRDAYVARYCDGGARALHRTLRLPDASVPFAVLPRCGDVDELTAAASHEIVEATTSPDPARPGFALARDPETIAFTAAGVEVVDPCGLVTRDRHRTVADGFVVQRAWSNDAAAQGHDPCVPAPADRPYVALIPEHASVRLPAVGDRVTLVLRAAADRPVSRWSVAALDLSGRHDGTSYLELALDATTVAPDETLQLTITARRLHPKERALVGLVSTHGEQTYVWPLAVMMR